MDTLKAMGNDHRFHPGGILTRPALRRACLALAFTCIGIAVVPQDASAQASLFRAGFGTTIRYDSTARKYVWSLDSAAAALRAYFTSKADSIARRHVADSISRAFTDSTLRTLNYRIIQPSASAGRVLASDGTSVFWAAAPTGGSGTVTSVATASPITGGTITTTGTISIDHASASQAGYISAAEFSEFRAKAAPMNRGDSLDHYGTYQTARGFWGVYDTASVQMIDDVTGGGGGYASFSESFVADYPMILDRIQMRHSYDSSAGGVVVVWCFSDVSYDYVTRDSVPAGAKVFVYYAPASYGAPFGNGALQVVGVLWMAQGASTSNLIGDLVQVPLLPTGLIPARPNVSPAHRGLRAGHWLRTSVRFVRKLPGVLY